MRRDRLQRRNDGSIFLDQLLYRTDIHPALLRRQEQCVFMPGQSCYCFAPIHIFAQHIRNFIRKIKNDALAAFSGNKEAVCLKIHILNVQPNTFAHSNARSQQKRNQCKIAQARFLMIFGLLGRHGTAFVHQIKEFGNFIDFQANDFPIMPLGHIDQRRHIRWNILFFE